MRNIAVILAGGSGRRMGNDTPKQFLDCAGRTVIEYAIDTFDAHPRVDEVAVVINPQWRTAFDEIARRRQWRKLTKTIDGGSERYMSTLNAIMAYIDCDDDTNLLLHDAARPLVTADVIDRVATALQHSEAVGVAIPCTDTVWEVHPDIDWQRPAEGGADHDVLPRFVARIPERRLMWLAQTPQAFRLPVLRDAYQRALQDPMFAATDDCSVVRRYMPEIKISVVEGNETNFKLTTPHDLLRAENVIKHKS